jgi:hypothetical protein
MKWAASPASSAKPMVALKREERRSVRRTVVPLARRPSWVPLGRRR